MLFLVGLLYAVFDRVIWASNVIAPFPRLSQLSISPKTRTIKFWRSWDTPWPSSPWIRSFRSVSLSCRRACRWNVAGSESDTQIVGDKVHTFGNESSKNELPMRWLETSEGTSAYWLVRGTSFIEFNCWISVLELAGSWKKTGVNRPGGIYQIWRTASNGFAESIMIHEY